MLSPTYNPPTSTQRAKQTTHRGTSAGPVGPARVRRCANAETTAPTTARAGDGRGGNDTRGPPRSGGTHASEASDGDSRGRRRPTTAAADGSSESNDTRGPPHSGGTHASEASNVAESASGHALFDRHVRVRHGARTHRLIRRSRDGDPTVLPKRGQPDHRLPGHITACTTRRLRRLECPSLIRQTRTRPPWSTHASSHPPKQGRRPDRPAEARTARSPSAGPHHSLRNKRRLECQA